MPKKFYSVVVVRPAEYTIEEVILNKPLLCAPAVKKNVFCGVSGVPYTNGLDHSAERILKKTFVLSQLS